MRTRRFSTLDKNLFVRERNLEDLLGRKGTGPYKQLGPVHDREARQAAKDLFSEMMGMIADDMTESNAVFVLPRKDFGYMRIGNIINDPGGERYRAAPDNDFACFGGKIILDRMVQRVNGGKVYRFILTRRRRMKMRELQKNGHNYAQ